MQFYRIIPALFYQAIFLNHPRSSNWIKSSGISSGQIDGEIVDWLRDQNSLTQRLQRLCPGQFSVRVLDQQWLQARADEARLLNIPLRQRVLLRQVQLLCDGDVYVYARSLIPLKTLTGKHRRLGRLGKKPLGAYLFANPGLQRSHQQIARITKKHPLFDIACAGSRPNCDEIWGRRSLFKIDHKPLLVSEYFLPGLFESSI